MFRLSLLMLFLFSATLFAEEHSSQKMEKDTVLVVKKRKKKIRRDKSNYWEVTSKKYKRYVGLNGDVSLSPGLSMKRWGDNNGLMFNILPFYYEENYDSSGTEDYYDYRYNGYDKSGFMLAGAAFMHKLHEGRMHRVYNYVGAHYYSFYDNADYYESYYWGDSDRDHVKNYSWTHEAGLGTGVGVEIWSRKLAIDVRAGIVGAYEFTEESKKILPSIGFGIYYRYDKRKK